MQFLKLPSVAKLVLFFCILFFSITKVNAMVNAPNQSGVFATLDSQLNSMHMTLDSSGNVWVDNTNSYSKQRLNKYSSAGVLLGSYIQYNANNFPSNVRGFVFDSATTFWVVGSGYNDVPKKFNINGNLVTTGSGYTYYAEEMVRDASGNLWIVDGGNVRVSKYGTTGSYLGGFSGNYSTFAPLGGMAMDSSGNFYLSDYNIHKVAKYNSSFVQQWIKGGGAGNDNAHFNLPSGVAYYDGIVYVADVNNNRIQKLSASNGSYLGTITIPTKPSTYTYGYMDLLIDSNGVLLQLDSARGIINKYWGGENLYQISNLSSNLDVLNLANSQSIKLLSSYGVSSSTASLRLKNTTGRTISDITVNMTADRDWATVVADSDRALGKAFVTNLTTAPGSTSTHTLYVPVPLDSVSNAVTICPNATSLITVTLNCSGGISRAEGSYSESFGNIVISKVSNLGDGVTYWKITGLTGTGGLAETGYTIIAPPPGINILVAENGWDTDVTSEPQSGVTPVGIEDDLGRKIAEVKINFDNNLSWAGLVTLGTDASKTFFHVDNSGQNEISALPGYDTASDEGFTLYIPKGDGDKAWICPGAASLNEVTLNCSGGYFISEGQTVNGATASVDGIYWKVSGLTGTGGMSVVTGLKDTLSRLQVSSSSDHTITFGTNNGLTASGQFLVLAFDPTNKAFDLSSLNLSDIKLTDNVGVDRTIAAVADVDTWGAEIDSALDTITFFAPTSGTGYYPAASQIVIKIGTNAGGTHQMVNPTSIGNYEETIYILNTDMEGGTVKLPIIDNDQVNVTGYVTAYMHFDIDTGVGEVPGVDPIIDCNFNTCRLYENSQPALMNYTVDLGELTSAVVNKSNTTSVAHSDGGNGIINSIYFDISTNAPSGAVVTVKSANGGLQGPGTNKIPSIGVSVGADGITRNDGQDIPANSGVYGYNLPVASSLLHGSIVPNSLCDSGVKFCGPALTPKTVFTTNNLPVDTARVRMDLAAAANYTNNPGLYTDTLTFIATSTF